jgi:hypothetical protein
MYILNLKCIKPFENMEALFNDLNQPTTQQSHEEELQKMSPLGADDDSSGSGCLLVMLPLSGAMAVSKGKL